MQEKALKKRKEGIMKVELIHQDENEIVFTIDNINPVIANTLRRTILVEVPTLAIKEVEFRKNGSALFDEIIAHRLGLIPLTTDLKTYNLQSECKCKGEGCALCQVELSLPAKEEGTVYSKDMQSNDPKIHPVIGDIPIVELDKGQKLEFVATAVLGKGKEHMKYSPGHVYYKGYPELTVEAKTKVKEAIKLCNGLLIEKGNGVEIADLMKWTDSCEQFCEENGVKIEYSDTKFLFFLESWGQLKPKEIVVTALDILDKKLADFEKSFSKAK